MSVEFILGCEECSETLAVIPDYEMMQYVNQSFRSESSMTTDQINASVKRVLEKLRNKK